MNKLNISTGDRFGRLVIIKELDHYRTPNGQINRVFLCKCDCGQEKPKRLVHLRRGAIKSCGCRIGQERIIDKDKGLKKILRGMKSRCSPNHSQPHLYYNKGIRVCGEWEDFYVFKKWALSNGFSKELQIDRIDGDCSYSPENCRWVTAIVNCNNRSNTNYVVYNGVKEALMLLIRRLKIDIKHEGAIRRRIERGWVVEKAIDTPIKKGNYLTKADRIKLKQSTT